MLCAGNLRMVLGFGKLLRCVVGLQRSGMIGFPRMIAHCIRGTLVRRLLRCRTIGRRHLRRPQMQRSRASENQTDGPHFSP